MFNVLLIFQTINIAKLVIQNVLHIKQIPNISMGKIFLTPWTSKRYPQLLENDNFWIGMNFFFNFVMYPK
jgi:hypothetical protein